MIEAKHNKLFQLLFSIYQSRLMKSNFDKVYWQTKTPIPKGSTLMIANHSSWWDGLLFLYLQRQVFKNNLYIMTNETGLNAYPFFQKLGAFSVNKNQPKDILKALKYSTDILKFSNDHVLIFPQGDEYHLEERPMKFQSGITYLMSKCPNIPVIPICIYYSFGHQKKPEVWIRAEKPVYYGEIACHSRKAEIRKLEQIFTEKLDHLRLDVINEQHASFINLL